MTINELRLKVEASEQKIEKCKKTIERHQVQMNKKADALRKMGIEPETVDKYAFVQNGSEMNHEAYWLLCDYDNKKDDIKGSQRKLEDAERILAGWKEKLDLEINKEKVIADTVPQVIKDFLENWKNKTFDWYVKRYDAFLKFRDDLRVEERAARLEAYNTLPEYAELRERQKAFLGDNDPDYSTLLNLYPRKPVEEFLKERDLDHKSLNKRLNNFGDNIIFKMLNYRDSDARLHFLDGVLEEDKKRKLLFLIDSITNITGPITDAKHLYISGGDLNGVVMGEKGVAKIQTFSAGGYNIQCFHYRTRVDDVSDKYKENTAPFKRDERVCTYQFPRFEAGDDAVARDYGLEVISNTKDDTLVKGQYRDIMAFADQYLGYQLVPEYLKDVSIEKPGLDEVINKCAQQIKQELPVKDKNKQLEK